MRQLLSLVLALVCPLNLCACVSGSESVELEVSTERYLTRLDTEKDYRACFEFCYSTEAPKADGDKFRNTMQKAYFVCDSFLPDEVS